ncbi:MAG: phospholipase D-like domain-containing protein [Sulfuricurvum sp.]|nr:phospholipase D-like domain-containing protein [Sulfuricurvum sp.]
MRIDVKFDDLYFEVENELSKATKSVKIAVAWISFDSFEKIFHSLLQKKVKLEILCTDAKTNRNHQNIIESLGRLGAKITLLKLPSEYNHMHHKFAIIDESTILNGSFNWTINALKSFENFMIIKDDIELVKKFMNEFEKISNLNTGSITLLQELEKCECNHQNEGKKLNILVFSNSPSKYNEAWADLIQICSECDDYQVLKYGIQDNSLHFLYDAYETLDLDGEPYYEDLKYKLDRDIDRHLNSYSLDTVIHAIAIVSREIVSQNGDDEIYTKILWKNKFVSQYIEDRYETSFGVEYD